MRRSATSAIMRVRSIASAWPTSPTSASATFSRGMRQRLGLAEILMKDVQIAILDEPTSGLDPQATAELLEMIRSLKRDGVAVLISSHLLERVQSVCDRVALFQSGNIALLGTVPELARQVLGGGYNVEVEADGEGLAEKFSEMPGVKAVDQSGPSRYRLLAERDIRAEAAAVVVNAGGRLRQPPRRGAVARHHLQPLFPDPGTTRARHRDRNMRREGSPWRGLERGVLPRAVRPPHQRAHAGAGIAGGAVRRRRWSISPPSRSATPRPKTRSCSCGCSRRRGQSAAVVRAGAQHPGAAHVDRARLRFRQRRIQPPHHVAHPGAADLSRRAAVREIPGGPRHLVDLPGHAVAPGDRLWPDPSRHSAERGGARPAAGLPAGDHRLCRRLARARHAAVDPGALDRDRGADARSGSGCSWRCCGRRWRR